MKRGRHKDGGIDWWIGVNNENEVQEGREGRMGEWRDGEMKVQRFSDRRDGGIKNTSGMEKNGETGRDRGMREMEG